MKFLLAAALVFLSGASVFAGIAVSNDLAVLVFDAKGRIGSLKTLPDGKELISAPSAFATVKTADRSYPLSALTRSADGTLVFASGNGNLPGALEVRVCSFGPGWTFEIVSCNIEKVKSVQLCRIAPVCRKYCGRYASMHSDDEYGVCLRAYHTKGRMLPGTGALVIDLERDRGFNGFKFGLVAARREGLVPALRRMTLVAGVPRTVNGGAWSLGSEANRGSYCFADIYGDTVEDWIDFALRGGFTAVHIHAWWDRLGHYEINRRMFPRGEADFKAACDKIHEAGLKVGMHTLTGAVQAYDAWMAPECREEFIDWSELTLARDLSPTDTVMYVKEPVDIENYHTFHSYSSRGNTLRAGTELIRYTGVKSTAPYAFTGIVRGAWKTRETGVIPAGTKLHYLYQRYNSFFPKPDSALAAEVAQAIAEKKKLGNVDQIYLDGAEAVRFDRNYTEDRYREQIMERLGVNMVVEGSNSDPFTWWYLSRHGAWDRPYWGVKRMHDQHLREVHTARICNLLEPQMGWWKPSVGAFLHPGHKLDDMEYFASRNAAFDVASSTQGTEVSGVKPLAFTVVQQMTLYGWYERLRMAKAFSRAVKEKFALDRAETCLRQDASGLWRMSSVDTYSHRANGEEYSAKWRWNVRNSSRNAALRVEALYYADTSSTNRVRLLGTDDVASLEQPYSVNKVESRVATGKDPSVGPVIVFDAKSMRGIPTGAAACFMRKWPKQPYFNAKGCYAFGLWVKGDGSGADLWLMLETPRLYHWGQSFHRVKLDFTGWRRFLFPLRERDISEAYDFAWREGLHPMVTCATKIDMEHLGSFRVYLAELPHGRDVHVEISEVFAMPMISKSAKNLTVTVSGKTLSVPFEMKSGDFAELENGCWTLYSEQGDKIGMANGDLPEVDAGVGGFGFSGNVDDGKAARAEVTLFARHSEVSAVDVRGLSKAQMKHLEYEAVMPSVYCPAKGVTDLEPVRVRPGETARLELAIFGKVSKPALLSGGRTWTFDVDLKSGDRLYCKDGVNWRAVDAKRKTLATGRFSEPLPTLDGGESVFRFSSADDGAAAARIEMVKRYEKRK